MADDDPNWDSVEIMDHIDSMPALVRSLVHEFGYVIIAGLLAEGEGFFDLEDDEYEGDPLGNLRFTLETWRERRQAEWLATDYVTRRTARSIVDAALARQSLKQAAAKIKAGV